MGRAGSTALRSAIVALLASGCGSSISATDLYPSPDPRNSIDFATGEVIDNGGDLKLDSTGVFFTVTTSAIAYQGPVRGLSEITVPPTNGFVANAPADVGGGIVVRTGISGCPVAVFVEEAIGQGRRIEWERRDCGVIQLDLRVTVEPCPAGYHLGSLGTLHVSSAWWSEDVPLATGTFATAGYPSGDSVVLTPPPAKHWSWAGACQGSSTCTVHVDGDEHVSATVTYAPACYPNAR